jgi:hypothetical protein
VKISLWLAGFAGGIESLVARPACGKNDLRYFRCRQTGLCCCPGESAVDAPNVRPIRFPPRNARLVEDKIRKFFQRGVRVLVCSAAVGRISSPLGLGREESLIDPAWGIHDSQQYRRAWRSTRFRF